MRHIYILEHLEPELFDWCKFEYEHISKIVGKQNLWITNISNPKDKKFLESFAKVYKQKVSELKLDKVCVLDPEATQTLTPNDSNKFNYFIFGGILGDYPPRKRTKSELTSLIKNPNARNIGKKQMATDNAVYVVHKILGGTPIEKIPFTSKCEVKINEIETIELPYRYAKVYDKPLISDKVLNYLKKKKGF